MSKKKKRGGGECRTKNTDRNGGEVLSKLTTNPEVLKDCRNMARTQDGVTTIATLENNEKNIWLTHPRKATVFDPLQTK